MAYPITPTGVVVFTPRENKDLAHDSLLIIFKAVITDGYVHVFKSLSKLFLVSTSWKQTADCLEIGRCLFHHMGWRFPKEDPHTWKKAYRLQTGNLLINDLGLKPTISILDYPPITRMHQQRIKWIEDKGFIYYCHSDQQFHVCLFENSQKILTINTPEPIVTLSVFKEHVVCGTTTGKIISYLLWSWEPSTSYQAHKQTDTIREIFENQDAWISISNSQIISYDQSNSPQCLLDNYNPYIKDHVYPSIYCTNQHLFFKFDPQEEIARTPIHYYMYSMRHPCGLKKISGPKLLNLRQTYHWGDQIAAISQNKPIYTEGRYSQILEIFHIHRFPFDPLSVYRGEPEIKIVPTVGNKVVTWNWKKPLLQRWQFHFRGDTAVLIWEDYESFEVKTLFYHIQLIDLKNEGRVIAEHCDHHIDIYNTTVANNKFIYMQTRLSKVVILDFPVNPSII